MTPRRSPAAALLLLAAGCALALGAETAATQDLSVDQAVREALLHNLNLLAEKFNVPVAEAAVVTARLKPNPTLSLGNDHMYAFGHRFSEESPTGGGPTEQSLRVDFVRERGGKRRSRIDVAEKARSVAQYNLQDTMRSLILDVQDGCIEVQQAKANYDLAHENASALQKVVEVNAARVKAGDLAEVDLSRSRVAKLQFENQVLQTDATLRQARGKLNPLLGRPAGSELIHVVGEIRRDKELPSIEEVRAYAIRARPDLLALANDRDRAAADVRLQQANSKVDWTVGAEVRRMQQVSPGGTVGGLFFSVPLPLYSRNQGEIQRARQQVSQLETRIRALQTQIQSDVTVAYDQCKTAKALVERIESTMLSEARGVYDSMEYSYRRGEASLLELLDARRAFNDTMQSLNDARADYARSLYRIDAYSGRSIQP
ncbi:MAG: TolC family protein [Candidatus Wallbacteria bacterium]|nr:TolC family protein [Candidatus Wallbacteria bacterium]